MAILVISLATVLLADEKATTDGGDRVILYENGTWEYINNDVSISTSGEGNKPVDSDAYYASAILPMGIYLNSNKWRQTTEIGNPDAEFEFEHVNTMVYGMVIAEKLYFPIGGLKRIVLENAQSESPDAKIIFEGEKKVNGVDVLALIIDVPMPAYEVNFKFYYYLYSKRGVGSLQVMCYTLDEAFEELKGDMEDYLNGFVLTDN